MHLKNEQTSQSTRLENGIIFTAKRNNHQKQQVVFYKIRADSKHIRYFCSIKILAHTQPRKHPANARYVAKHNDSPCLHTRATQDGQNQEYSQANLTMEQLHKGGVIYTLYSAIRDFEVEQTLYTFFSQKLSQSEVT